MSEIYDLALTGLNLVEKSLAYLAPHLSKEDQSLLNDMIELQYKAVQVSAGMKLHPEALKTLIDRVNNQICSINNDK